MKAIKSVDIGSVTLYGAVLAFVWTLIFGIVMWIFGWIFGATSWWIDMNLGNWTAYTLTTFSLVFLRALIAALAGAVGGLVVALVYNIVAGMMGGIKIDLS